MALILVVDNEPSVRMTLTLLLKGKGYQVLEAADGRAAIGRLREELVNLVITDLKMPEVSGLDVLQEVKTASPETEVILLTGHGTIESAVEAMRLGAFDYVTKPFEPSELLHRVQNALNHHALRSEVRQGRFREDLYYRLNVVTIPVPALRERRDDIPLLAAHFLEAAATRAGRPTPVLSQEALRLLLDYPWPGNVRELQNAIERAILLAPKDVIFPGDLPPSLSRPALAPGQDAEPRKLARLEEVERQQILRTLDACGWNQARAAETLGIGRNTLWRSVKEYGIQPPERRLDVP